MIRKEIFKDLIRRYYYSSVDDSPALLEQFEKLYNAILDVEKICNSIYKIKEEKNIFQAQYKSTTERIENALKNIQETCKHESTSFSPDPAGGNDSYTECIICGKII